MLTAAGRAVTCHPTLYLGSTTEKDLSESSSEVNLCMWAKVLPKRVELPGFWENQFKPSPEENTFNPDLQDSQRLRSCKYKFA